MTSKSEINKRYNDKIKLAKIEQSFVLEDNEKFKIIEGHDKYRLTNKGRVFSTITCAFLIPHQMKTGYLAVTLSNRKRETIHRLLATHFIDNPKNYPAVDHIDRNRTNNDLNNLRWASFSENNSNKKKGSIYERVDTVKGKEYKYWRVSCYPDGIKKTKSFKSHDKAIKFHNETRK